MPTARVMLMLTSASVIAFVAAPAHAQDAATKSRPKTAKSASTGVFVVQPYLQLGDAPRAGSLRLLWHADESESAAEWAVEYRTGAETAWRSAEAPKSRKVAIESVAPHRVFRATFERLEPGAAFEYRVRKDGREVFSATGSAPKGAGQPYRFVAFGDCGAGKTEQKPIAYQAFLARPDLVVIPGDIVYERGRISEYRERFWPVYNADSASLTGGVPLLRSTLFVAAPGNHDIATRDLKKFPDGLAYFLYWDQPLNGPDGLEGSALLPKLEGPGENKAAFVAAAGAAYPRMANFSFDYGNAHWTILDANSYVDWKDHELQAWVERDLAAAQRATWRFVSFHQPGFNSSRHHYSEQKMRLLSAIFEKGKVDVVWNGHVHNYQRSYPLRFVPGRPADDTPVLEKNGKPITGRSMIPGHWTLDKSYDGRAQTRPEGVIYVVTGAGGATLYDPEQQDDPATWQGFTVKFISKVHSLTVADVDGATLTVRQLSGDGEELDRFVVTK